MHLFFRILGFIALAVSCIGLGYYAEQSDFTTIFAFYLPFFLTHLAIFQFTQKENTVWFFVGVAIFLRCSLLFTLPHLSDDVYRFIWDGRLLLNGHNPFDYLPSWYIEQGINISGLTEDLYQKLNSPDYFTIYPPVAQLNFAIAVFLFPDSILGSTIVMKSFLLCFEIGSIFLIIKILKYFQLPLKNVLIYALNPLIIIEIVGNLHFEGAMIFFLLLAFWLVIKEKINWSAVAFALSIASKLLPLMFLPFFIARLGWKKSLRYFSILGISLLLLFLPLINGVFVNNFGNSLNLYFQKFEFNASVYYLLRWLGYQWKGYNLIQDIGPFLALGTLTGILLLAFWERKKATWKHLPEKMLFAFSLYLAFTTIVHPWYTALPLVLCLFTPFRYPVFWTGLIFLTYVNYSYEPYWENLWVVGLEYGVVMTIAFLEFRQFFQKKKAEHLL